MLKLPTIYNCSSYMHIVYYTYCFIVYRGLFSTRFKMIIDFRQHSLE